MTTDTDPPSDNQDGLPEVYADLWAHHHRLQVHGVSAGAYEEGGQLRRQWCGVTQGEEEELSASHTDRARA